MFVTSRHLETSRIKKMEMFIIPPTSETTAFYILIPEFRDRLELYKTQTKHDFHDAPNFANYMERH